MEYSLSTDTELHPNQALQHLKDIVETALAASKTRDSKYSSKLLVCFQWETDDIHGGKDCDEISQVFKEVYGAEVVRIVMEMKDHTPMDVLRLVHSAVGLMKESQLVVIFYSGHGSNENGLIWHPKSGDLTCRLVFKYLEVSLLTPLSCSTDVLLLLDCCCAMAALKGGETEEVTHEIIGACGANAKASVRTFTPAICNILKDSPTDIGLTASNIHRLMLNQSPTVIHTFLLGTSSISLVPVAKKENVVRKVKEAVICIHLNEDIPPHSVDAFLEILSNNQDLTRSGYVKLLDTRKTDSTMILAIVPLFLASLLSNIIDVALLYIVE